MPHRVSIDGSVGGRGRLLHPHGRQVEELVHDLRGERLDGAALARSEEPSRAFARSSSRVRIASARARSDAIAGTTSSEACQARKPSASSATIASARTASWRRPATSPDDRLEVVDVVEVAAVELVDRGVEVARDGEVDKEERAAAPRAQRRSTRLAVEDVARRAGRGDDDVGVLELGRHALERRAARPPKRPREPLGARSSERLATKAISTPREVRFTAASSLIFPAPSTRIRRPPRSPKTCSASSAAAEETEAGLSPIAVSRADLLARVERLAEEPVEQRPGRAGLVGAAHLAEDLALARAPSSRGRRDAEEVQRGRLVA